MYSITTCNHFMFNNPFRYNDDIVESATKIVLLTVEPKISNILKSVWTFFMLFLIYGRDAFRILSTQSSRQSKYTTIFINPHTCFFALLLDSSTFFT